ncbi:MAG: cold shock domain-containing protein [Fibrobacter sp.]|nr:cold shock domain-containing protein [Fibrobacter sp.]
MLDGIVRMYNEINGSGLIEKADDCQLIKFSYKDIKTSGYRIVHEGQKVYYDIELTKRGPIAVNVIPQKYD